MTFINYTSYQMKLLVINTALFLLICSGCSNDHSNVLTKEPNCHACTMKLCDNLKSSGKYHAWCEIMASLFEPNAIKIDFYTYYEVEGKKDVIESGSIWYSKGLLFIQCSPDANNSNKDNFNCATINGNVYGWNTITHEGLIYKRYDGDTFAFLNYFIDASGLKMDAYDEYLKNPKDFIVTEHDNIKTIKYINPRYGYEGIQITENPFWLYSYISKKATDSHRTIFVFERPRAVTEIPKYLKKLPDSIIFKGTEETLESEMVYL